MSARDRAFSRQDREVVQEMIDEGFEKVTPAMKSREERLQFVEQTIPSSLLKAVTHALTLMMNKLDQPVFYTAYEALSVAYSTYAKLINNPANASKVAPELLKVFEETLGKLVESGFTTWNELLRHSEDNS
jgi:hypothetical protein